MKRPLAAFTIAAIVALGITAPSAPALAATAGVSAKAKWVNDTVTVVYSWDGPAADAIGSDLTIRAGATVVTDVTAGQTNRIVTATRSTGKTVAISAVLTSCTPDPAPVDTTPAGGTPTDGTTPSDGTTPTDPATTAAVTAPAAAGTQTCTDTTVWSAHVTQHTVTRKAGQVSASTLLGKLKVTAETHTTTYARTKFKLWVDANHDGENTRAEVLKAESKKPVTENSHHTVTGGRWVSPYDGKTVTIASKLDIDHLVPLEEAWTSGAYAWSVKKRTAYANDLGYAPSLIAVSQHANRSKGDKEPNAYLPAKSSYVCAYVRNYIAVKYRWGLKVDPAEKAALQLDLATSCINPYVTKPGTPNLTALVSVPRPFAGGGNSSGGGGTGAGGGSSTAPAGATAICRDGTYSYSQHHQGTCSHHGGVLRWL